MNEDNKKVGGEKSPNEKPRYVRQYVMHKRHKRTYGDSRPEPIFTQPEIMEKPTNTEEQIAKELLTCAEMLAETDARMLAIRREIEHGEETEDVDTQLLEKLKRLDVRI
jgi:hypothetical protein